MSDVVKLLQTLERYEWGKATDDCNAHLTIRDGRAVLAEITALRAEVEDHLERRSAYEALTQIEIERLRKREAECWKAREATALELVALRTEVERLRAFVRDLFEATSWPEGGDLDLFAFQELCEEHGLLTPERRTEPCGDECFCAEYNGDMSDGVTCYRKADWITTPAVAQEGKPNDA